MSITSVSAFHSMSDYYLILWSLTCNFNFENKYTWKLSYLTHAYFSFIFKFRKLKLSTVIRFLILQKVMNLKMMMKMNLIKLSRQQVCHKPMLITSRKKWHYSWRWKRSCLQMLKYSFNFTYAIDPRKDLLHNLCKWSL